MSPEFVLFGEFTLLGAVHAWQWEILQRSPKDASKYSSLQRLNDLEVMQFTGLKDKNGKDIFEGDIVECDGYKMTVQWNEKFACFCLMHEKWMYPHFFGEAADNDECEVISNIYETPELLKQ